jgi:hypothetical protein
MHTPITTLKSAARDPESTTVIDVVRKLFNLQTEPKSEPNQPAAPLAARPPERATPEAEAEALVKQIQK